VIIALFQGFILQQAWGEQVDIDAYVEVIASIQFLDGDRES
jgi:hypothetical protein